MRDTITKFEAATDSAKKELARGTVADVRKRLETYRASLVMLRRLVPERNEVPNLLDDISTREQDPRSHAVASGASAGRAGARSFRHLQVQHVRDRPLRSDRPVPGRRGQPAADHRSL